MHELPPNSVDGGPAPEVVAPEELTHPSAPAESWWRRRWRRVLLVAVIRLGGLVALALLNKALPDELIRVDFRAEVEPFNVGESSNATYDHVEGTYRLTVKNPNGPITSLGEFARTAYAVGIRAEVVEITKPGSLVGALCLGTSGEGADGLAGYGFFVGAGGDFVLGRQDPGGRIEFLQQGADARVDEIRRISVTCVPGLNGDVTISGYANGLEIVTASDPDGYGQYTYAGISVVTDQVGTEVSFTRVGARVPDGEWAP